LQPFTVIYIPNVNCFAREEAGGLHESLIYRDAAFVVQVSSRYRGAVNLRFHHLDQHGSFSNLESPKFSTASLKYPN
jgi:hypothetical protein